MDARANRAATTSASVEFDDGIKANNKKHQGERGRGQWGANDPRALHPRDDSESLDDYARSSGVKLPAKVR